MQALQSDLAEALLSGPTGDWDRLVAARRALAEAVQDANAALARNPLTEIVAAHALHQMGLRGTAQIRVAPDGTVLLEGGQALPTLQTLRSEAEQLGLDIAPYGKNRTQLKAAIDAAKANPGAVAAPVAPPPPEPVVVSPPEAKPVPVPAPSPPPEPVAPVQTPPPAPVPVPAPAPSIPAPAPAPPKMVKTAPALSPARILPDSAKTLPADDDVANLFVTMGASSHSAPPPRMPKGRSLSAIAASAEAEVDLDALLPKQPPR